MKEFEKGDLVQIILDKDSHHRRTISDKFNDDEFSLNGLIISLDLLGRRGIIVEASKLYSNSASKVSTERVKKQKNRMTYCVFFTRK